ncbi:uncharacterized protein LOC118477155 [Aplysia californica]|uniref:Uncharacterized protein LOC118477155 n=1 Tax=Aplysia californica TaxID=6500 RepID=A0ABM1VS97_APLCA|nr:uncharacterized protein LOC118477155 [Aplysia californica]
MASSAGFEESINSFTHSKTGERIYLDLATENVINVRPLCKRGSIPLGALWVHVLQHANNYPVCSFPYKDLYRAGKKYELQLRVDGISITINLDSGQLVLRGRHVLDWFVSRFQGIMTGYCSRPGENPRELREVYTQQEMEALQEEREKIYKHYLEEWPVEALERAAKVMEAGKGHSEIVYEPVNPSEFLKGEDLETVSPLSDLLSSEDTLDQLERLRDGRVIQGSVLYRLWRSAFDVWFSDKDARVFVVTPHIDVDRLTDLCMLFLTHKLEASLVSLSLSLTHMRGRFAEVRSKAIKRFPARDQVYIEYKIYNSIVYPVMDFTTSFIAMVKEGRAHILQTNTAFDRESFITTASATVQYIEIDEGQFVSAYLDPILL